MADAVDLKSTGFNSHMGSSPIRGIKEVCMRRKDVMLITSCILWLSGLAIVIAVTVIELF